MEVDRIYYGQHGKIRTVSVPFRKWPARARLIEKLYRLTHGGQIRTLVVPRETKHP